jgi:hypothetical protein
MAASRWQPAETLLHVIEDAKAHQGKVLIAYINRAINLLIRPAPGAWVGALEVFTFADRRGNKTQHPLSEYRLCSCIYDAEVCSAIRLSLPHPGHLKDQSRAPLPGEIGPEPLALHTQSVLQLWKRHEMQDDPNEPGDKPTHAKTPAL